MANSLRITDNISEKAVAEFLDKKFYPFYVTNFKRHDDFTSQMCGIDVEFDFKGNSKMLVDEKTLAQYVNKNLPTAAFEIEFIATTGNVLEGWLFDESKKTEFYLISWIQAIKEENFSSDDITQLEILIIKRQRIIEMLKYYGITKEVAFSKAKTIRQKGAKGPYERDFNLPFYFFFTTHLSEMPINIVIKKDMLIKLSLSRFIINK